MERPCTQQDTCPLRDTERGCFTDTHHLYFPRRAYRTKLARAFRELPENKVELCRWEHQETHTTQPIPEQPAPDEMRQAIYESQVGRLALDGQTEMAG